MNEKPRQESAQRELAEDHARLAGIIGSAMDAIISVDAAQRITLFNAAAEKMFGCPASVAIGQPLQQFIPARFREAHSRGMAAFGRTGVATRVAGHLRPLTGLRANGEEFPAEASISQAEVGGKKIYTVILRDVAVREGGQQQLEAQAAALRKQARLVSEADEKVSRLNQELEHRVEARTAELTSANRELESFAYSVAHDLRAPLRHIDAFGRILEEEYASSLPPEAQHYLECIRTGSRQMSQLLDDLLNLSRVARQALDLSLTPLGALVEALIVEMKDKTDGRTVKWRINPLPTSLCDPGLIKQVFAELLGNAVKYTRPRDPAVIEVGTIDYQGGAAIFVRDNGVGFNMKYADKLFGVFQRLHRTEEFEGTGVGLATVDRIIRKHGGCVWAEGAVGKGAVFYFTVTAPEQRADRT
jgi:PAS domain S-box-containing protein